MSLVGMKLIALVLKKNTSVKCLKRGRLRNIPIHGGIEGDDEVIEVLNLHGRFRTFRTIDGMIIGIGLMFNTTLTELNLDRNNISDEGAIVIGEGLKINTTLIKLRLSMNKISDEGAIVIGEGLKINTTLIKLSLLINNISDEGAIGI